MVRIAVVLAVLALLPGCDSGESAPPHGEAPAPADPEMGQIIADLDSSDPRVRSDAALRLMGMGMAAEPALPALAAVLGDPSPVVMAPAACAIGALAKGGSEEALRVLVSGLGNPERRRGAVNGLEIAGPIAKDAVPALKGLTDDPDERVRWFTVRALASIGGEDALTAIARQLDTEDAIFRAEVCWGLSRFDRLNEEVIAKLEGAAQDPDSDVAAAAAFAIWKWDGEGDPAVAALSRALRSGSRIVEPLEALAVMGPLAAGAVDDVLPLLEDVNTQLRAAAARALGCLKVGTRQVVDALAGVAGITEVDCAPQTSAVMALGELGPAAAPAARAVALHLDGHPAIAFSAENTLLNMGPACIPALETMLADDRVSAECKKSIRSIINDLRR